MVEIRWLESAKDDLKDIYDFIASDSNKYAKHQILKIKERLSILKHHPLSGKMVVEYDSPSIREISFNQYRIIYRIVNKDLIHILLVHHGARKFPRIR